MTRRPVTMPERTAMRVQAQAGASMRVIADLFSRPVSTVALHTRGINAGRFNRPDLTRHRRIVRAYDQARSGIAGTIPGLVERFGYADGRSLRVAVCRGRKILANPIRCTEPGEAHHAL